MIVLVLGSLTRNSTLDLVHFKNRAEKKKIYDAMSAASIVNNSAGVETSRDKVIPLDSLLNFLAHFQQQGGEEGEAKRIIEVKYFFLTLE